MIKLGAFDLGDPREAPKLAACLDRLGYERIWFTEHRSPVQSASPLTLAAIVAAQCPRIRVGTAGVMLRYLSPLKLAEDACLVQLLFRGRLDLGTIGGKAFPATVDEALVDGQFSDKYEEKFRALARYLHGDVPRPGAVRSDPPDLWLCSTRTESALVAADCAAKFAYGLHIAAGGADASAIEAYRDSFRGPGSPEAVLICLGVCEESDSAADRVLREIQAVNGDRAPRLTFFGGPTSCCQQLQEVANSFGVTEVVVMCLGFSIDARIRSFERLSDSLGLANR